MNQKTADSPLVSLVIPVFNSMPYLIETLDAIEQQGLDENQLEVILVNDGSTDGSEKVLADYAEKHPNYRLLNQPNSGGPADPCNKGIAAVTGKYFFVVGSDDVLTENALGDLAAYAEEHDSDIVLARMAGINGRHAPGSMFKATKPDAHLVKDRLFNSLTAIKLFRTDLVTKTGAHNPTHLRIGSDQPFTAACYLVAKKISVRADRPFVMIRKRDDGKNVTSRPRTATEYSDLLTALVDMIIKWSEPGELRDGVLHRPVHGAMRKTLLPRFLDVDEEEQERIVSEMQRVVGPHFNDAVAAHLGSLERVKARLALAGRIEELRALIQWEKDGGKPRLAHDDGGFRLDLPEVLTRQIGVELLRDVKVVGVARLDDVTVEGGVVSLEASGHVRDASVAPDEVVLRMRLRDTEQSTDYPVRNQQSATFDGAPGARFRVELDSCDLNEGVWDLCIVQRFGGDELENRLGRNRSELVTDERRILLDAERGTEIGVAYFTKGYGNLSLDIGYTLLARTGPRAVVVGVLDTGSGRRIALLRASDPESLQITIKQKGGAKGSGEKASIAYLEDGLVAVSVPEGFGNIRVANDQGALVRSLPKASALTGDAPRRVVTPIEPPGLIGTGLRAARGIARRFSIRRPRFLQRH
ncbi:glycosyltransferase [Brachybacterium alimentarium]|uniref:glycosyltransferase n=1 Tax=Brachybacterium alimentarium TaxID=47845 RepID=UPI000DF3900F|nr:glycosyltransferase [Brachybacterium alimentarium]RCS75330.1 glycosyltransferase family 2 protein [Brachybacterium alimentarium]